MTKSTTDNNHILDIIIWLTEGVKSGQPLYCNGYTLWDPKYLLNQTLRQYCIPVDHYYVSLRAKELWDSLTSSDMMKHSYQAVVLCDRANNVEVHKYVGNEGKYRIKIIKAGDKIKYREVFHDDHIVPLSVIIKELISLDELNYQSVLHVLDKIRICKMLKDEDKATINKSKRPSDYRLAIAQNYLPADIHCINVVTGEKY